MVCISPPLSLLSPHHPGSCSYTTANLPATPPARILSPSGGHRPPGPTKTLSRPSGLRAELGPPFPRVPICRPDPSHRAVCCLPGARVRDVAQKLPGLVRPSDYYPLLVMRVGGDEIAERSPKAIKRDSRALGRLVEGSGAQVVFSSVPSVTGNSTERGRNAHLVNRWLRDWCQRSNFGFFGHGEVYTAPGLLAAGASQLSQRGKRILGHELAGLIERALN